MCVAHSIWISRGNTGVADVKFSFGMNCKQVAFSHQSIASRMLSIYSSLSVTVGWSREREGSGERGEREGGREGRERGREVRERGREREREGERGRERGREGERIQIQSQS